ncbi:hypothetical protein A2Z10_02740 [Candidatus Azambacteria bacterium RBG_16_47_10]|uniref:Uncharacterized protein n=1 Tax=Candidatus Azambacteria bacterium RBG_16_47_10 TaxID=1797292 RepID=A0A1F5AZK3_9BACT|nr:MAG: hypothetical protein A2Z10_02740 [Candidatus Azambacteria bacterium RBG_16_47_10]
MKVKERVIPLAETPVRVMMCVPVGVSLAPPVKVVRISMAIGFGQLDPGKHDEGVMNTETPCGAVPVENDTDSDVAPAVFVAWKSAMKFPPCVIVAEDAPLQAIE